MAPGAFHQARWLSKTIYTLVIWLFRNQFRLTAHEENRLQDVCIFIIRYMYVDTSRRGILLTLQLVHHFNNFLGINQLVQTCQRSPVAKLQDISGT